MNQTIKIGVFGARRGCTLAFGAKANGMTISALCDYNEDLLQHANKRLGKTCQTFTDFREMLKADIDAVVIANYATDHTWAVCEAMAAGKHVMSECMACFTLAEAVQLVEAVEKSGKIYMFAENYPYFAQNQEMKRLFDTGKYGKFVYGEGEYVHPISAKEFVTLYSGLDHWRSWLPSTYYCTHSMGPVMYITNTRPVSVNGFIFPHDFDDPEMTNSLRRGDSGSILVCKMDNDAVVKLIPWANLRDHGQRYRICCNRGIMEYNQGDARLRLHTEPFDFPNEGSHTQWYTPNFPQEHREALRHGHGGGDYFTSYHFAQAMRTGIQPFLDVYRAIDMTIIGILGYRSALNNSNTVEVPDFRKQDIRDKYRHDDWNPDPKNRRPGMPLPSILGEITPSQEAMDLFKKERDAFEQKIREESK